MLLTIDDIGAELVSHSLAGQLEQQHASPMSPAGNQGSGYHWDQSLSAKQLLARSPLIEPCSVTAAVDQVSAHSCQC